MTEDYHEHGTAGPEPSQRVSLQNATDGDRLRQRVIDGVAYLLGSAGSLILACHKCGEEHFREPSNYFGPKPSGDPAWHKCFSCGTQMEPIRIDELDSRWRPFWRHLGWLP